MLVVLTFWVSLRILFSFKLVPSSRNKKSYFKGKILEATNIFFEIIDNISEMIRIFFILIRGLKFGLSFL